MSAISCHRQDFTVTSKYKLLLIPMAKEQWWTVYNLSSFSLCHSDKSCLFKNYYLWDPCWVPICEILITKVYLIHTVQYLRGSFKAQREISYQKWEKIQGIPKVFLFTATKYIHVKENLEFLQTFLKKSCYFID